MRLILTKLISNYNIIYYTYLISTYSIIKYLDYKSETIYEKLNTAYIRLYLTLPIPIITIGYLINNYY